MTGRSMPPPAWPASATRGDVIVPPQVGEQSLRKQTVLDEETYASGLSRIIQRDFFPDLARLRAQNAYLTALDEGTMDDIEETARKLVQEEARCGVLEEMVRRSEAGEPATPLSMPPSTPRLPETPLHSMASTPSTHVGGTPINQRAQDDVRTSMTMGQYQAAYTTEDNASFAQLMEVARKRRRDQYQWAYDAAQAETEKRQARITHAHAQAEQGRRLALPARLAIEGRSAESDSDTPSAPPKALPFVARGALMYAPDANTVGPARPSTVPASSEKPRVYPQRTRMTWATEDNESAPSTPSSSLIDAAVAGSPRIQGYGFVSVPFTPQHAALSEQRMEQLMTWGQLAATPRRLDATPRTERTERSVEPPTPSAPAPEPSRTVQAHRSHKARRIEDLSPAARHLLQRTTRTGSQLYKPAGSSTPRSARWTPTPSPVARR
ncbi:hypothetical protein MEQU1_000455 [Malassezia equina]|uniref:Protein DGCR14 n=1 Tax=Malassezia equina TaxID=1381935 RepID=A0AAF0EB55_9BASI|nr:hypothetical protein MEQU1_000455 [Malassezia equina]